jgi:hypothetical protein
VDEAPVKAPHVVYATSKAIPEVQAVQVVPLEFKAVQLVNELAIATQAPELKVYPEAQKVHVKTPALVALPYTQLVLVVGIATHCPHRERYFPVAQALQVKTPAVVADPLVHPALVNGIATQVLLET